MQRTELVKALNDGAALLYAMALTAVRPRYRARLFANARMQRVKAALAWCGVSMHVISLFPIPVMCEKALGEELAVPLERFKAGDLTEVQVREILMNFFDMNMSQEDHDYLVDYLSNMMASFTEDGGPVGRYAYEIGGVIEAERDHAVARMREAITDIHYRGGCEAQHDQV